ncbi:MAG: DinB family protein [Acidobacteriota bacterium]
MSASIADRLRACWSRSDQIFDLLEPGAIFERPITLRHPLIFYLGHLPAFAWNQVCRGVLGMPSFRPEFDSLFERGIDPVDVDAYESAIEWPPISEVLDYRDRVRSELVEAIAKVGQHGDNDPLTEHGRIFEVASSSPSRPKSGRHLWRPTFSAALRDRQRSRSREGQWCWAPISKPHPSAGTTSSPSSRSRSVTS